MCSNLRVPSEGHDLNTDLTGRTTCLPWKIQGPSLVYQLMRAVNMVISTSPSAPSRGGDVARVGASHKPTTPAPELLPKPPVGQVQDDQPDAKYTDYLHDSCSRLVSFSGHVTSTHVTMHNLEVIGVDHANRLGSLSHLHPHLLSYTLRPVIAECVI